MTAPVVTPIVTVLPPAKPGDGPGQQNVGGFGTVIAAILFGALGGLLLYLVISAWPHKVAPSALDSAGKPVQLTCAKITPRLVLPDSTLDPACVTVGPIEFPLWAEHRLLAIVLLAGALGGMVHALRSLGWYIGQRDLKLSWLPYYALLPLVGSALAVAFYIVLRGGLISPAASVSDTSTFGMAAVAVLVGMFSTPASLKLQQVAETFFTKAQQGADAQPQHAVGQMPVVATTPDAKPVSDSGSVSGSVSGSDEGERGDNGVADAPRSVSSAQG